MRVSLHCKYNYVVDSLIISSRCTSQATCQTFCRRHFHVLAVFIFCRAVLSRLVINLEFVFCFLRICVDHFSHAIIIDHQRMSTRNWKLLIFDLDSLAILGCNCHISGSIDRICDQKSGQCKCHPHVVGRTCDRCEHGFWDIDSKKGCQVCSCDVDGSEDQNCDTHSGQCKCKPGVEGLTCDKCRQGYYGFSSTGCRGEFSLNFHIFLQFHIFSPIINQPTECSVCDSSAKICDQTTGRCVCPPNTHGADCNYCFPNTWGWALNTGNLAHVWLMSAVRWLIALWYEQNLHKHRLQNMRM